MRIVQVSFFFFKQKTAYEMRISDWSSDVCSSDLPGPVVKLAITRSSSERVKDSSQPATTAGAMIGKVIWKNVRAGGQPRSMAASSIERSKLTSRDCTTTAT